jgi:Na+/phosphate symporter
METTPEIRKIEIDDKILKHLNIIRRWAMFLAVTGFIILGLVIVIGLIAGTFLAVFNLSQNGSGFPESLMFIPVLLLGIVYFFPGLFLFRFSKHSQHAIKTLDKKELQKAFRSLKSYFVYTGVLILLALFCYVALIIFEGTSISFLKGLG